jgi:hypothetical protein
MTHARQNTHTKAPHTPQPSDATTFAHSAVASARQTIECSILSTGPPRTHTRARTQGSPVHAGCIPDLERGLRVLARRVADGHRDVLAVEARNLRQTYPWCVCVRCVHACIHAGPCTRAQQRTTNITRTCARAPAMTLTNVDSIVGLYVSTKWSSTYRITVADFPAPPQPHTRGHYCASARTWRNERRPATAAHPRHVPRARRVVYSSAGRA